MALVEFLFRWGHVLFGVTWIGLLYYLGPQGYLWVKSSSFDRRTPCGQAVDFTPPSLAA